NAIARGPENAHERVAQNGIADVADVRRFVGIDAGVLDHLLRTIEIVAWSRSGWTSKQAEQFGAIEEDVDVTRARDFNARDFVDVLELRFEFLGQGAWVLFLTGRLLDEFREFERDGEGQIAELRTRRHFGGQLFQLNAKQLARCRTSAVFKFLL